VRREGAEGSAPGPSISSSSNKRDLEGGAGAGEGDGDEVNGSPNKSWRDGSALDGGGDGVWEGPEAEKSSSNSNSVFLGGGFCFSLLLPREAPATGADGGAAVSRPKNRLPLSSCGGADRPEVCLGASLDFLEPRGLRAFLALSASDGPPPRPVAKPRPAKSSSAIRCCLGSTGSLSADGWCTQLNNKGEQKKNRGGDER